MNRVEPTKDEHDIAVIPYVVYDALMERFERMQKDLRSIAVVTAILSTGLVFSIIKGAANAGRKDT